MSADLNQAVDKAQLRSFGLIMAGMIVLFFGLLIPWIWGLGYSLWPWLIALGFAVPALLFPGVLEGPYHVWMKIGLALGWVNSRIILSLLFFVVFLPVGLVLRVVRDPMHRALEPGAGTYRRQSTQPNPNNSVRPF